MHETFQSGVYRVITAIDAVTATTVSEEIVVAGAKKIALMFTRANHSAGSTAFTVEVSLDGTTYVAYNKLISNATNTNAQTLTRVASVSLASNTSSYVTMDLEHDTIYSIRVTATETTDGTHTAKVMCEW
jgi:N-acetyl-beta-hexosaminidase